jgi:hypothetical protein
MGAYYAIVDGRYGASGAFSLTVTGELAPGASCHDDDPNYVCTTGYKCSFGACAATACNDGVDNGDAEDTVFDVNDPGCTSLDDDDETNPTTLPRCANGSDDDMDGKIDYPADLGCGRAGDDNEVDCIDSDPIVNVTHLGTYSGTTTGAKDDEKGTCGSSYATAKDVVHQFTVPGRTTVTLSTCTGTSWDTVLYVKSDCSQPAQLACDDEGCGGAGGVPSKIANLVLDPGTYYIYVDGYYSGSGAYKLSITGTVADDQPCDPMQHVPGFLTCNAGKSCVDKGTGYKCQTP